MSVCKIEGIVLHALKFKDYDQIFTLFTPDEGIVKMLLKHAYSAKFGRGAWTAPLTRAEFVYTRGTGDLRICREVSLLGQHLPLRENLDLLEASSDMLQATSQSQAPNKAAPDLYKLLIAYLEKLPLVANPHLLAASFRLKILRHEGLLNLASLCTHCQIPLNERYATRGENYCRRHAPPGAVEFSEEEALLIELLAYAQTLGQLTSCTLPEGFVGKVKLFFRDLME